MSSRVGDGVGEGEGGVSSRKGRIPCLRKASSLIRGVCRPWLDVIWPIYAHNSVSWFGLIVGGDILVGPDAAGA